MPSPTWSVSKPIVADPFLHFTRIRINGSADDVAYPRSFVKYIVDDPVTACVVVYFVDGTSLATKELFDSVLKRLNE